MSRNTPDLEAHEIDEQDDGQAVVSLTGAADSTRRRFIVGSAAAWASTSLAGCSSQGAADTESPTASPTATPSPTPEPPENYVVSDDMAAGSEGIPEGASFVSSCAPTRKFIPGMHAIWHVGVYDPETGEQLTNGDLGENAVVVEFPNKDWEPVELQWAGDDEEHASQEWNGALVIPEGAEPGEVSYTINIKQTEDDANFRTVGIAANTFEIIEYTPDVAYVVSNYTYAISSPKSSSGFVGACGPEWQYMPGMTVAFAANVFDADTGKEPGPDTIDSVTVEFDNENNPAAFDPIELAWQGDAEEHAEKVWDGTLELPDDTPTGTYAYNVVVTAGADNVVDVGIASDSFTVINPNA